MAQSLQSNIQGRPGSSKTHGGMLFPGSLSSGLLYFLSDAAQAYLPRGSAAHSGLGPPTSISNQGNVPQTSVDDHSSIAISSSQICLGLCLADKNYDCHLLSPPGTSI